ncbi:hypothetical protein P154DRAFT_124022 [Amniculicola lignicola CBS 123094]|uniref:Uncharacterized protein n=1 Tax=Amniculicola lignicola CBS 123094 TaxID=1392246 RepID=A0A6A5WUT5_9PLEO|nr:hypothetical protein P154DRAFT_124022 [Amniculicola lignicola CBS 123094]
MHCIHLVYIFVWDACLLCIFQMSALWGWQGFLFGESVCWFRLRLHSMGIGYIPRGICFCFYLCFRFRICMAEVVWWSLPILLGACFQTALGISSSRTYRLSRYIPRIGWSCTPEGGELDGALLCW